jgi:hypothetical protein
MPIGTPLLSTPMNDESWFGTHVTWPSIWPCWFHTARYCVPLLLAVRPTWVTVPVKVATPAKKLLCATATPPFCGAGK